MVKLKTSPKNLELNEAKKREIQNFSAASSKFRSNRRILTSIQLKCACWANLSIWKFWTLRPGLTTFRPGLTRVTESIFRPVLALGPWANRPVGHPACARLILQPNEIQNFCQFSVSNEQQKVGREQRSTLHLSHTWTMFAFDVNQAWFNRVIDVGKTRCITTWPVPTEQHQLWIFNRTKITNNSINGGLIYKTF